MMRPMPSSSPTSAQITAALRAFVAQWFRAGNEHGLEDDTPLVTSGIVDSAGVVEVVEFCEKQWGVAIGDDDVSLQNCNTLRAWTELVGQKLARRRSPPGG